jgi:hypothetical protein
MWGFNRSDAPALHRIVICLVRLSVGLHRWHERGANDQGQGVRALHRGADARRVRRMIERPCTAEYQSFGNAERTRVTKSWNWLM